MKKQLVLLFTCLLTVSFSVSSSYAKSIWLKCGNDEINLDATKGEFNTKLSNKLYQGKAVFFPSQVNFQVHLVTTSGGSGFRDDYTIDRKTLTYTKKSMIRFMYGDWKESSEKTGKCLLIEDPNKGNKI